MCFNDYDKFVVKRKKVEKKLQVVLIKLDSCAMQLIKLQQLSSQKLRCAHIMYI